MLNQMFAASHCGLPYPTSIFLFKFFSLFFLGHCTVPDDTNHGSIGFHIGVASSRSSVADGQSGVITSAFGVKDKVAGGNGIVASAYST